MPAHLQQWVIKVWKESKKESRNWVKFTPVFETTFVLFICFCVFSVFFFKRKVGLCSKKLNQTDFDQTWNTEDEKWDHSYNSTVKNLFIN